MVSKIGYARVSTAKQKLDLQVKALRAAGCEKVFTDKVIRSKAARPGLDSCLANTKTGDTLFVWRLARLGRSMSHMLSIVQDLKTRGVGFRSIQDGAIDTTTASGELIFNIFHSLAQFERELIRERSRTNLTVARSRGKMGGRPSVPFDHPKIRRAKEMSKDLSISVPQICKTLKVSRLTYYRYLSVESCGNRT